jgi:hypothetical protein
MHRSGTHLEPWQRRLDFLYRRIGHMSALEIESFQILKLV